MDLEALPLSIAPMRPEDIAQVMQIERESFSLPWPEGAYRHELTQNELAHYYVLYARSAAAPSPSRTSWQRWWDALWRPSRVDAEPFLGYGGFWLMYDEAHISTLAVPARYRRHGFGELLLIALLDEARRLGAQRGTLEVRVSNSGAQALYAKYAFEEAGRRRGYYNDNGEDALILTTAEFDDPAYRRLLEARRRDLLERLSQIRLDKILQLH